MITRSGPATGVATRTRTLLAPGAGTTGVASRRRWVLPAVIAIGIAFPFVVSNDAYNLQLAGERSRWAPG